MSMGMCTLVCDCVHVCCSSLSACAHACEWVRECVHVCELPCVCMHVCEWVHECCVWTRMRVCPVPSHWQRGTRHSAVADRGGEGADGSGKRCFERFSLSFGPAKLCLSVDFAGGLRLFMARGEARGWLRYGLPHCWEAWWADTSSCLQFPPWSRNLSQGTDTPSIRRS